MTPTEFVAAWQKFNLGGPQDAQTLFTRADTNDDGIIDAKDIPAIFAFFDQNGKYYKVVALVYLRTYLGLHRKFKACLFVSVLTSQHVTVIELPEVKKRMRHIQFRLNINANDI